MGAGCFLWTQGALKHAMQNRRKNMECSRIEQCCLMEHLLLFLSDEGKAGGGETAAVLPSWSTENSASAGTKRGKTSEGTSHFAWKRTESGSVEMSRAADVTLLVAGWENQVENTHLSLGAVPASYVKHSSLHTAVICSMVRRIHIPCQQGDVDNWSEDSVNLVTPYHLHFWWAREQRHMTSRNSASLWMGCTYVHCFLKFMQGIELGLLQD